MKIFQKYKLTELIDGLYNLKSSYLKSKNKGIEELVSEDLLKIHDEIVNEILSFTQVFDGNFYFEFLKDGSYEGRLFTEINTRKL